MDSRNRILVVGLYFLGAICVGAIGLAYYSYLLPSDATPFLGDVDLTSPRLPRNASNVYPATLARANQSVRELQHSLTTTRDVLAKRSAALNQKNAECRALRDQLDQSLMLMLSLLDEERNPSTIPSETNKTARAKLDQEVARIKESVHQSESMTLEQEQQLTELQAELIQADLDLAAIRTETERELALLHSEKEAVADAAGQVVARCGPLAVPYLVVLLPDERVEIRRWAAQTLGALGPEARDAQTALRELLADPDSTVRTVTAEALLKIE